jgi:hypothetical protein
VPAEPLPTTPHHPTICRIFGSALALWIPLLPIFLVLRQFLRTQAGATK